MHPLEKQLPGCLFFKTFTKILKAHLPGSCNNGWMDECAHAFSFVCVGMYLCI